MAFNRCRFCDCQAPRFQTIPAGGPFETYRVECPLCKNSTGEYSSKDLAFWAWNKENRHFWGSKHGENS